MNHRHVYKRSKHIHCAYLPMNTLLWHVWRHGWGFWDRKVLMRCIHVPALLKALVMSCVSIFFNIYTVTSLWNNFTQLDLDLPAVIKSLQLILNSVSVKKVFASMAQGPSVALCDYVNVKSSKISVEDKDSKETDQGVNGKIFKVST